MWGKVFARKTKWKLGWKRSSPRFVGVRTSGNSKREHFALRTNAEEGTEGILKETMERFLPQKEILLFFFIKKLIEKFSVGFIVFQRFGGNKNDKTFLFFVKTLHFIYLIIIFFTEFFKQNSNNSNIWKSVNERRRHLYVGTRKLIGFSLRKWNVRFWGIRPTIVCNCVFISRLNKLFEFLREFFFPIKKKRILQFFFINFFYFNF